MTINLTTDETQYLVNIMVNRDAALPQLDTGSLTGHILTQKNPYDFTSQEVGILQSLMQEQLEVNGSQRSVANEKEFRGPGTKFVPNKTLVLIKSISDKLGAHLTVDITTKSDQHSGREEGSTWIMTDPTQKPICG
jgi:hypothetical protein